MLKGQSTITSYSNNGTYLDLVRIPNNVPTTLSDGVVISIGGLASHEVGFKLANERAARCSMHFDAIKTQRKKIKFDEEYVVCARARVCVCACVCVCARDICSCRGRSITAV